MRPTPGEWNRAEEAIRMTDDATGKLREGRWYWMAPDVQSVDFELGVERLTDGRVSYRVMHPDGENLARLLEALRTENEEWRQRAMGAVLKGVENTEDRDYMARIYVPTRDKNNELERMVGELSDKLRISEAKNAALKAEIDALTDPPKGDHTPEES
jgi:hypothetical protein